MRRLFTFLALGMSLTFPGLAKADPPLFQLTLNGPAVYQDAVPITFSGVFTVGGVAVPSQPVTYYVDGTARGTTTTGPDGSYSFQYALPLAAPYSHYVRAFANDGSVLSTSAPTLYLSPPPAPALVINEVDYDQPGTDFNEFVEIYNPSSDSVSLTAVVLVLANGATNQEYGRIPLSGTLPGFGYAIVATPSVPAGGAALVFPLGASSNAIQNGQPDGVALFYLANKTVVDAVSYEGAMTAVTFGADGIFDLVEGNATVAVDGNTVPGSLARLPDGVDSNDASSDWVLTPNVTPGSPNS